MRKALAFFLSATLFSGSLCIAAKLSPAEKATLELTPAVVLVVLSNEVIFQFQFPGEQPQMAKKSFTETGSGFIYRPDGYLLTNGHVVWHASTKDKEAQADLINRMVFPGLLNLLVNEYSKKLDRKLTQQEFIALRDSLRIARITPNLQVYLSNRKAYQGEIKTYSDPIGRGKDVAVIKIDGNNLPTVRLGNSDNVQLQEPMVVIGYPGVATFDDALSQESVFVSTVTNGHVSAIKADYKGTPVIQSDAAITHGNSGGPAFNAGGEAIGIATFGNEKEVAGFNFFVPINTAWEFVRSTGTRPEPGLFNRLWAEALDFYDAGKCGKSMEKTRQVLNIVPNQPDATRLAAKATGCYHSESWFEQINETAPWLVYAVAGLVILGGGGLVLKQRKASSPSAPAVAARAAVAPGKTSVSMPAELPPGQPVSFGSVQVTAGSLQGRKFKVTKEGLLIGRDPAKCQVVLNEDTVSKEHAWIVPVDQGVVVIDRGSANGTFVNSTESPRVSKVGLQNGDRVFIGKQGATVLTYYTS